MNYEGERFLLKLYQDLAKQDSVLKAEKRSKENSSNKFEVLKKYLNRLEKQEKVLDSKHLEMEKYLKNRYYDKYVIKEEDIPDSYWHLQQKIALERGYGHINYSERLKHEESKLLIEEQKKSLEKWIDYLMKENTVYPMWARYWAFQGMLKLGQFDKAKGRFTKRSKGTVSPFIDLNPEALAYTISTVQKYYEGEKIDDSKLSELIENGNFGKIYSYNIWKLNEEAKKLNESKDKTEDGIWKVFKKGDTKKLVKALEGKGTGWCIAGETVAKDYLDLGDMHIYFTKDKKGKYNIPRVCIRQEEGHIAEVRGIEKDQNLEAEMNEITDKKLDEFEDKEAYKKKVKDMKRLTELYNKKSLNKKLTNDDYKFLYEAHEKINGFGWQQDPRIDELRSEYPINNKDLAFEVLVEGYNIEILDYINDDLKKDKELMFKALQNNIEAYKDLDSNLKEDKEFSKKIYQDKKIMLEGVKNLSWSLKNASDELKKDRDFILEVVKISGDLLSYASKELKDDREVVLAAVSNGRGTPLRFASERLRDDKEIVLEAVKNDSHVLPSLLYASERLKNDKEVVLASVKANSATLKYASEELKNDKEVFLAAYNSKKSIMSGNTIQYAGKKLLNDREFILPLLKKHIYEAEYLSDEIKSDRDFMLELVKTNGNALNYASKELKDDREIVFEAVSNGNGDCLRFASERLKNDEELIKINNEKREQYLEDYYKKTGKMRR